LVRSRHACEHECGVKLGDGRRAAAGDEHRKQRTATRERDEQRATPALVDGSTEVGVRAWRASLSDAVDS
jgi:hypothetical protein